MCGFAGWVGRQSGVGPAERLALLQRMGDQLARRGPDDQTFYDDGELALTFRRLAIIDQRHGRQPIFDESGTTLAVVNGEIYNHRDLRAQLQGRHRLASRSDCEVVVHLHEEHGDSFLERLNGMFALCVWDRAERRGLLARDRLGIKPLYYAWAGGGLLFASELKALLAHPGCPRVLAEDDLDLGYVGTEEYTAPRYDRVPTFVHGVALLAGGEWLPIGAGRQPRPRRYWSLQPALDRAAETPGQAAERYVDDYADLLSTSLEEHLAADVPVGAFLSGGLDSSLLVAGAAARGASLDCFSVREQTTIATGDLDRAAGLAKQLDLPFHAVRYDADRFVDQIEFGLASLEELVWAMDAPRFAPELFFKYELHRYATTVRPDLKVMIIGQGADEFAGGYSRSYTKPRASWAAYEKEITAVRSDRRSPFQAEMLRRLVVLQSHNLWNEDRVAAAHGVEARVPFLDHRLVELLAGIPVGLHPQLFFDKRIIRDAAARWLPRRWREAPKVLFWQSEDRSSVHAIMAGCAHRAYPELREAYASEPTRRHWSELDAWFAQSFDPGPAGRVAVQRLLSEMTVMIFVRMCVQIGTGHWAVPPGRPSSLRLDQAEVSTVPRGVRTGVLR